MIDFVPLSGHLIVINWSTPYRVYLDDCHKEVEDLMDYAAMTIQAGHLRIWLEAVAGE